jgi:hypothetical protein
MIWINVFFLLAKFHQNVKFNFQILISKWFWRIFSSVVQFLDFSKTVWKNQNQRTVVFQKIEIKEPSGSRYFKTVKGLPILSPIFPGSVTKWEPPVIYLYNQSEN